MRARTGRERVYAMRDPVSGRIKIGHAANPGWRVSDARTWVPDVELIAVGPGGVARERCLHWQLRAHHVDGEWFLPHPDVLAAVRDLPSPWQPPTALPPGRSTRTGKFADPDEITSVQTVKLPTALSRSARRRMVDDGLTYQRLLSAAVEAYVAGEWTPSEEDGR